MLRRFLTSVVCVLLLGATTGFSQEITGAIVGTARDVAGAAIPGATVTIRDTQKNVVVRTLTTNEDGEYSAPQLPVGLYEVTVEAANFKKYVETAVKLDVNQRRTVDAKMEAGNIAEVVTVEAEPLQVDLQTPTAANLISGTQVRELALNNRNFVQLVTLVPGVSNNNDDLFEIGTTDPDSATGAPNIMSISVNGARQSSNTYSVDGADTTDRGSNITIQTYPSVDAIGEFKVLRSLYPADTGRSAGGQINVVTRSGTNEYHGTLYEFVRNEKLNANDYFTNQNASAGLDENGRARRRPFRYNDFGGTVGGPLPLPRFGEGGRSWTSGKNKTFFFFSQEARYDIRYPSLPVVQVPDANLRRGIFPIAVCIRFTGSTCNEVLPANTQLPASRISPVAQSYVNEIFSQLPLPNLPNFQLAATARNQVKFNQQILKIDHSFTQNFTGFYRFQNDSIPSIDANAIFSSGSGLPGVSTTETKSPGRSHVFRTTWTLTPQTILDSGFSYSYGAIKSNTIGLLSREQSPTINVALPFSNATDRVPTIAGIGFQGVGGFGPYDNFSFNKSLFSNLSLIRGSHTAKTGVVFSYYRKNENAIAGSNEGTFTIPLGVLAPGVANTTANTTIQRWANFLIGQNVAFSQARFDFEADLRAKNLETYAQDEWRVLPNLTLYYGVRYSIFGQPIDKNGRLTNFDPRRFDPSRAPTVSAGGVRSGNYDPFNGFIVNSQNVPAGAQASPYGEQVVKTDLGNIAPRVGLAWDPFKTGRTAIRTGYGVYHDQALLGIYLNAIGLNPVFQPTLSIPNTTLDNPLGGAEGTPSANVISRVRGVDVDFKTPYTQQWSLDVQQQVGAKTVVSVGYYGSKGTHLLGLVDLNLLPPGAALNMQCRNASNALVPCQTRGVAFTSSAGTTILDQVRPYRGYRSVEIVQTRFNSNYHSLQTFLQHRFTTASQVNAAYTLSKNLTDNWSDRSHPPQNPYDTRLEYGRAQLDRRHIFSLNYIYELPFHKDQRGAAGRLLGGWELSGIVTYNSGVPFTATTSSFDPAGVGFIPVPTAGARPNQLCDPNEGGARTQQQWFNTDCFQRNPASNATNVPNVLGNAPRGSIDGPPTSRVDFTVMKNLRLGETTRLQLRGEAFNIFNHTNFRTISTNVTASNFGAVTAARDPRVIQLGVKFYW